MLQVIYKQDNRRFIYLLRPRKVLNLAFGLGRVVSHHDIIEDIHLGVDEVGSNDASRLGRGREDRQDGLSKSLLRGGDEAIHHRLIRHACLLGGIVGGSLSSTLKTDDAAVCPKTRRKGLDRKTKHTV